MTSLRKLPVVWLLLQVVCAVAVSSCGSQSPTSPANLGNLGNPGNPTSTTGQVVIYTKASGWNSIDVSFDGSPAGKLSTAATSAPSCSSASSGSALVLTKPAGTYAFNATSNGGFQWSTQAEVKAGTCTPLELTCPNGDCGGPSSCLFSVSPTSFQQVSNAAGTLPLSVVASSSSCPWTSSSNSSFLNVAPASGTGSGVAIIDFSQNAGDDRSGTVTVAGKTITVNQFGSKLEGIHMTLQGNTAFTVSSPQFPALSNTCWYVPVPSGQFTTCLMFAPHGDYQFVSTVPLAVTTGCNVVSADRRTCTLFLRANSPGITLKGS
jgi:hypothetical protein